MTSFILPLATVSKFRLWSSSIRGQGASSSQEGKIMTKVLLVVTGSDHWTLKDGSQHPTGYWAAEFIHPHQVFAKAGYDITTAAPGGVTPTVDEISLDPQFNAGQSDVDAQRRYLADLGDTLTRPA